MSLEDVIKKAMGRSVEKALTTGDLGEDFLPKEYAQEFIDLIREKNWCRQLFKVITMPGQVFDIPQLTADGTVYYVASEAVTPTAESKPTFGAAGTVRLTAKKLMAYVTISNETDEDSKIAMLPLVKNSFAEAIANAEEMAFVQGDTGIGWAAGNVRLALDGLVKKATTRLACLKDGSGNEYWEKTVEKARYTLGKYGRDVRNLVLMVNPYSASLMRANASVLTVDKYGPSATIHAGELGKFMGITVIEHPYIPEDISTPASTFDTPAVADKGIALLMRVDNPIIGDRRKVKFAQQEDVTKDSNIVAISERIGFSVNYQAACVGITGLNNSIG